MTATRTQPRGRGRPAKITREAILREGRALGMHGLSVKAVAARLGVSSAALYRHVDGRWGLERLVGEDLLIGLVLRDEGGAAVDRHLLAFALQLRAYLLQHPGLAHYMQTLFPRGEGGQRIMLAELEALERRGYTPGPALVLSSSVASLTISLVVAEQRLAAIERDDAAGILRQREAALALIAGHPVLLEAHLEIPQVTAAEHVHLLLAAATRGFAAQFPPGRTVAELTASLRADD